MVDWGWPLAKGVTAEERGNGGRWEECKQGLAQGRKEGRKWERKEKEEGRTKNTM